MIKATYVDTDQLNRKDQYCTEYEKSYYHDSPEHTGLDQERAGLLTHSREQPGLYVMVSLHYPIITPTKNPIK